jgi:hypothetical protein
MTRDELIAVMRGDGAEKPIEVRIERWGTLYVRLPSVAEVEALKDDPDDEGEPQTQHALARSAARIICDADGKRLFDPDNEDDVALLAARRWADLQKVLTAGQDSGN